MIPTIYEVLEYNDVYIIICNYEKIIEIVHECNYRNIHRSQHQRKDGKWQIKVEKRDILKWAREELSLPVNTHITNYRYEK